MLRAVAAAFVLTAVCAGAATAQASGKAIFEGKGNCHTCHGKNAKGTTLAPDLTDGEWLNGDGSLDSIRTVIRNGVPQPKKYPTPMPPLGGARLNAREVDAVAEYVRSLSAPRPDATETNRMSAAVARGRSD